MSRISPTPAHLQGRSVVPLMIDPSAPWKEYAVGRFRSGDTIRSEHHRYSEYTNSEGVVEARMLYDHDHDPHENSNVSESPQQAATASELADQLRRRKERSQPQTGSQQGVSGLEAVKE